MDVACLGLMVCDILVKPITKEILEKDSARVEFVKMCSGGDALNVAMILHKLGVDAGIIGQVGNDGFGRFLLDAAAEGGVDTRGVAVTDEYGTSTSVVMIHPDGERSFAYYGGATDMLHVNDVNFEIIRGAKALFVGSAFGLTALDGEGLTQILRKARAEGIATVLDVTGNPDADSMAMLRPALAYTDMFLPSYYEAKSMTGKDGAEEIARALMKAGVPLVVIKMGNRGCFICSNAEQLFVPAFPVDAVDTTGAGDSFVSGFLTGYLHGWPLHKCGRFANACGALCVLEAGATTGVKGFDQVMSLLGEP